MATLKLLVEIWVVSFVLLPFIIFPKEDLKDMFISFFSVFIYEED